MRLLLLLLVLLSCSKSPQPPADDYVLIEFASKLEEDYQKLHPEKADEIRK